MIEHRIRQNGPEWHRLRCGLPTASCFDRIVTPAKGDLSKSSIVYMYELLAEYVMGHPITGVETHAMARGTELEEPAAKAFSFEMDMQVEPVGFITTDDGLCGASPDRKVVGQNRIVEIKAPNEVTHMRYLLAADMPNDYRCQIQGQLMVGGYDGVYAVSYHPELPISVVLVERDEEFIGKMRSAIAKFCEELRVKKADLDERYGPFYIPLPESESNAPTPFDITEDDVDAIWAAAQEGK